MSYFILFLVFNVASISFAQNKPNVDSIAELNYAQISKDLYHSKRIFEDALNYIDEEDEPITLAKLYHQLGIIYQLLTKYPEAVEYFNRSILLYEKEQDMVGAGNTYAEMGHIMRRRDIDKAKIIMEKGIDILEKNSAPSIVSAYDNYGVILKELGKPDSALLFYKKALELKIRNRDSLGIPYSLQKIAIVNASDGVIDDALDKLDKALEISQAIKDTLSICQTYSYYGDVYAAGEQYQKAAEYYERSIAIAKEKKYNYLVTYAYRDLPDVYFALGDEKKAFQYLKESNEMNDSLLNIERVRSIAELEMFYENTQKEQKIQLLERDLKIEALNKRLILGIVLFLLLIASLLALLVNRQRLRHKTVLLEERELAQQQRLTSMIIAEEKERERVARELHDGLGQLLSATKMHVSALEDEVSKSTKPFVENAINLVDKACVEVREISHALLPKRLDDGELEIALKELEQNINSSKKVKLNLNIETDLTVIKGQKAVAIYRIVQELINNTLKHANASEIQLHFEKKEHEFQINYKDNGKNFNAAKIGKGKGIGWKNIESRIDFINGKMKVMDENRGCAVRIEF